MTVEAPSVVKVGLVDYDLALVDELEPEGGVQVIGRTDHANGLIEVQRGLKPAIERSTVMHEVLHAVFNDAGAYLDRDDEERLVRQLEGRLVALLRDNPGLVAYLTVKE